MTARKYKRQGKAWTPNHAAVEAFFPGVVCRRVEYRDSFGMDPDHHSLRFMVEASAEVLISNGLTTSEQIQELPPCGIRRSLRRTKRGTYQVEEWS